MDYLWSFPAASLGKKEVLSGCRKSSFRSSFYRERMRNILTINIATGITLYQSLSATGILCSYTGSVIELKVLAGLKVNSWLYHSKQVKTFG